MNTGTLSVGRTFKTAWSLVRKHIWLFISVLSVSAILYLLIEALTGGLDRYVVDPNVSPALAIQQALLQPYSLKAMGGWALSALLLSFVGLGVCRMSLLVVDGVEPLFSTLASSPKQLLHCFLAGLLYNIAVLLGLALFILPGLLLMARLQFFFFFILEEDSHAIKALSQSWEYTSGKTWKLLGFTFACIALLLVGLCLLAVGVFVAASVVVVAYALVYDKLRESIDPKPAFESL